MGFRAEVSDAERFAEHVSKCLVAGLPVLYDSAIEKVGRRQPMSFRERRDNVFV